MPGGALTRAEIQALTGLSRSAIGRVLTRFPRARVARGSYTRAEPEFNSWLTEASSQVNGDHHHYNPRGPRTAMAVLPSGVFVSGGAWHVIRHGSEPEALAALDYWVSQWRLPPHQAVPDVLPWEPIALPCKALINRHQWAVARGDNAAAAQHALDVLLRSWPEPFE